MSNGFANASKNTESATGSSRVEYVGKDLEAMDLAENYREWILSFIRPYLGKHLVEVGAGTGAFSKQLLSTRSTETLAVVEPSNMFDQLRQNLTGSTHSTVVRFFRDVFRNVATDIRREQLPDSIIYINVLEHIEDDQYELSTAWANLSEGGRIFVFVPAQPFLFSQFDKYLGHFRRYRKLELEEKFRLAGFTILHSRNFDLPGIVPWFIKYRMVRSLKMQPAMIRFYDRLAVPFIRSIESVIHPPLGKNLLIIGEKRN
jgi:Methyltransferase domain